MNELETILAKLHEELAKKLLQMVRDGEPPASVLKEAREFLKDNGINDTPKKGTPLAELQHSLTEGDLEEFQN